MKNRFDLTVAIATGLLLTILLPKDVFAKVLNAEFQSNKRITDISGVENDVFHYRYKLGIDSVLQDFPKELEVTTEDGDEMIPVTWKCLQDYTDDLEEFEFIPEIDGYELLKSTEVPKIKIEVEPEEEHKNGYEYSEEEHNVSMPIEDDSLLNGEEIEPYYNAYERKLLPSVRDQGLEGACWAFSTIGCIEADLIRDNAADRNTVDLSELHLLYLNSHSYNDPKNCHNKDTRSCDPGYNWVDVGGNNTAAHYILENNVGLIGEPEAPYYLKTDYAPNPNDIAYLNDVVVTGIYEIPIEDKAEIKKAIKEHGGVSAAIFGMSKENERPDLDVYFNVNNSCQFGRWSQADHAVMLVGWDDNYSASKFDYRCQPLRNGAWLVRNSWADNWGDNQYGKAGYFWLSYEDASLLNSGSVTAYDARLASQYNEYCYAYDGGMTPGKYNAKNYKSTSGGAYPQVKFTYNVTPGETITAVGYDTVALNVTVKATITYNGQSVTVVDTPKIEGFNTKKLDTPLKITGGGKVGINLVYEYVENGEANAVPYDMNGQFGGMGVYSNTEKESDAVFMMDKYNSYSKYDPRFKLFTTDGKKRTKSANGNNPNSSDVREKFTDVENRWYVKAIQYVVDNGIMSGTGNGKFEPNTPCSRTMMVQMLYNMEGKPSCSIGNHFSDVNSKDWFYNAVLWAVENKVTSGTSPTTFGKGNVTREQMATFLMNYANAKGYSTVGRNDASRFEDSYQISGWALEAMKWANASGIINGTSATEINPKGEASRAEVAQMLMNFTNCFEP